MVNFETISPKKNAPDSSSAEILSPEGAERRKFMKSLLATATATAAGKPLMEIAKKINSEKSDFSTEDQILPDKSLTAVQERLTPTETQVNIEQGDFDIIGKTFKQQINDGVPITLDETTR